MPMCTWTTKFRKGGWELTNLGEGKSELTALLTGSPIKNSGVTHQWSFSDALDHSQERVSDQRPLPFMELMCAAVLVSAVSR